MRESIFRHSLALDLKLNSKLNAALDSLTVMVKQELTSSYYNRKTKRPIDLKEQIHDYIVTKLTVNEKRVIFSRALSLHNCVYYLTEIVFREILEIAKSEPFTISKSSQLRLKCNINEFIHSNCAKIN